MVLWGYHKTLTPEEYKANVMAAMASPALRDALLAAMPFFQRAALMKAADEAENYWLRPCDKVGEWLRVRAAQ